MTGYQITSLITSTLTPIAIVVLGYWFNRRLKEIDHQNEHRNQLFQEEKEQHQVEIEKREKERREELERRYEPHIEFTMDAKFFGPQEGYYIAEFVVYANNKSLIRHNFSHISLRVRGIRESEQPTLWKEREPRLAFPNKLFESSFTPENWKYMFVEPGVKQEFTFVARVEESFSCVIARAKFNYNPSTPHTIERVFAVTDKKQSICND